MLNPKLLLSFLLVVSCAPTWAAEPSDEGRVEPVKVTPAKQPPSPPKSAPAAETPTLAPSPAGNSSVAPPSSEAAAPPAAAQTPAVSSAKAFSTMVPSEPLPGPYEADRKKVRNWLMEAKKRGVGLNAYMPVWNDMETAVKSGASDAAVKAKLDTICRSIGDQVKQSSSIQRWRPVKPKPNPDEGVETIRVKWIGEKGDDPTFRNKADRWYNNAVDMLPREQRSDSEIRRRLHDQRDQIYKEMSARWASGEKAWGPRTYKNMNQKMGQYSSVPVRETNQNYRNGTEGTDSVENNSRSNN